MEGSLYIRIRGRVQGPFEMEKLRALARRGQFSRMHQVSTDGAQWQSASDYPELFSSPVQATAQELTPVAETSTATAPAATNGYAATRGGAWFYAQDDKQFGPVEFDTLKELAAQGQLRADDAVWTEGMSNWATADSLTALSEAFQTRRPAEYEQPRRESSARGAIGSDLLRTLGDSQGWVLFIAVVGYLYALCLAVLGLLQLAGGARVGGALPVASGLFSLLYAALGTTGATLLLNYRSRVAQARYDKNEAALDNAFRALGRIWLFTGIVLIVALVGIGIIVIWGVAFASSVSSKLS